MYYTRRAIERTIPVPPGAEGFIIGRGGENVKRLRATPCIRRVNVTDGQVSIIGETDAAIDQVETVIKQSIQQYLARTSQTHGYFPEFSLLCLEDVDEHSLLEFVDSEVVITQGADERKVKAHVFEVVGSEEPDELETLADRMGRLGFDDKKVFVAAAKQEMVHDHLLSMLKTMPLFDPASEASRADELRLKVKANIGKTFFTRHPHSDSPVAVRGLVGPFGKNYNFRFSTDLLKEMDMMRLRGWLGRNGFEKIRERSTIVVHLVDMVTRQNSLLTLRPDDTTIDSVSKEEHEQVRQILSANGFSEALGLTEAECKDPAKLMKAFRKRGLQVHPEKNAHPGAALAFRILEECYTTLKGAPERATAANFQLIEAEERAKYKANEAIPSRKLPKVYKYAVSLKRDGFISFLNPGLRPDVRVELRTYKVEPQIDAEMMNTLEKAWQQRTDDGFLTFGADRKQVRLVRNKNVETWSNGTVLLKLQKVSHKKSVDSHEVLAVKMSSLDLKEMSKSGATLDQEAVEWEIMKLASEASIVAGVLAGAK
ncbi:hypothetical protein BC832DRAFT_302212 [Gaertneriomyces semiglobifer]|nr:hypothetical protein BC832DRAFT_302212 [Gaertneriomyces semiglobifer]